MNVSVLIIAHNEEAHIRECIESVLNQSKRADEIVLIAHNCTDKTISIAQQYTEIIILEHISKETWPIPAREYGFNNVTGDIIACIDGDSYVVKNWLQEITRPLLNPNINSVAWYPTLLWGPFSSFLFFLQWLPILNKIFRFYFWWGNFACRKVAYEKIGWMSRCPETSKTLLLNYPAEDCILSFLLQQDGEIAFARKARSYVYLGKFFDEEDRWQKQREDLRKIKKYIKK